MPVADPVISGDQVRYDEQGTFCEFVRFDELVKSITDS